MSKKKQEEPQEEEEYQELEQPEPEQYRQAPISDLDMNMQLTDAVWGKDEVPRQLREKLTQKVYLTDKEGRVKVVTKEELWSRLAMYTRDMRLGNLSDFNNEIQTCRYMIDLSSDLLNENMTQAFGISISRAATILETSQSKSGFLRRMMNTLRHENVNQQIEPPKKGFFGGNRNNGNNGNGGGY